MKIVNLRIKPKKEKKESPVSVAKGVDDHEEYPWGLRLNFDDRTVSKLGLKPKDMKVGSTVKLEAKAFVCGARAQPNGKDKSIELQLVELGVDSSGSFEDGFKDAAESEDE